MIVNWPTASLPGSTLGVVNKDGRVEQPQRFYSAGPIPRSGAGEFDEESVVVTADDGTITQVRHGRRGGIVHRWGSQFPGQLEIEWVRRGDGGQGMGPAEFWTLARFLPNIWQHNPTMAIGQQLPIGSPNTGLSFSPLVYSAHRTNGKQAIFEGCTIPLEFSPTDQTGSAFQDHGGNDQTHVLWWRMRMFQRITANYRGIDNLHVIDNWSYFPNEWKAEGANAPAFFALAGTIALCNLFGTTGPSFYDPVAKVETKVADAEWSGNAHLNYTADGTRSVLDVSGDVIATRTYPFSRDYGACFFFGASMIAEPIAVGLFGRCFKGNATNDQDPSDRMRRISQITLHQSIDGAGSGIDDNTGQSVAWTNYSDHARAPGWVGNRIFFFALPATTAAEMKAFIDTQHARGIDDEPQPFDVPRVILDGIAGYPNSQAPVRGI